jgi:geranylgeranylglycerol-phosphate geranylgeranyltransferase
VDLGEEIAADSMDIEGDRLIDSRSLAITYGKRVALTVSGCIFSTVIVLTIVPFALRWIPSAYLPPIILMDIAIAYSTYKLLTTQDNEQEGRKHIRRLYLGATLGLVVFLVMRIAGV